MGAGAREDGEGCHFEWGTIENINSTTALVKRRPITSINNNRSLP